MTDHARAQIRVYLRRSTDEGYSSPLAINGLTYVPRVGELIFLRHGQPGARVEDVHHHLTYDLVDVFALVEGAPET